MDECLDWEGGDLPARHPYSFRGFMERHFYGPVDPELAVPEGNRHWPDPTRLEELTRDAPRSAGRPRVRRLGAGRSHRLQPGPSPPVQPALGRGAAQSTARVQENNLDTIVALGAADVRGRPTSSCRRCR